MCSAGLLTRNHPFLQPRIDFLLSTPYGVFISSLAVGVALYSTYEGSTSPTDHFMEEDQEDDEEEPGEVWGRQKCALPRLRVEKTTCMAVLGRLPPSSVCIL